MLLLLAHLALSLHTASAAITQRDLRGIFVHHQEYCRETASRIGTGGKYLQHRTTHSAINCQASSAHEWYVNSDAVLEDSQFQVQLQTRRRQLADTTEGHVYLARVAEGSLVTSELRSRLGKDTDVTFDDYFKSMENGREYFLFYSNNQQEMLILENDDAIDEVVPLLPEWKLSPLLLGDDGYDDDDTPDAVKTLQIRISRRSKSLLGSGSMHILSARMQKELRAKFPATMITVQSAGAEAATHFATSEEADNAAEDSEWMIVDQVPAQLRDDVSLVVASFAETARVEPVLLHTTSNAWARWVTQSYTGAATDTSSDITQIKRATIWNRGITGEGQVVGVADSGLAHKNCLFNEPGKPITVATGATFTDPTHRKVVQYVAFADGTAGEDRDHGTHVSGSVAGNASANGGSLNDYNGMAPAAKLAFFDIGEPGARGLRVPNDLARNMFPLAYTAGARIHTNSWGSNTAQYTATSRSVRCSFICCSLFCSFCFFFRCCFLYLS